MPQTYPNTLEGIARWACDAAGLPFSRLDPTNVDVLMDDDGKVIAIIINHPDGVEPIRVQVGSRQ